MTFWYLIIMLNMPNVTGGVAMHSVEFDSKAACEAAKEAVLRTNSNTTAVCVWNKENAQ